MLAVPGAEYDGHSGNQAYASLLVAKTGKALSSTVFVFTRGRCSDGGPYASGISLTLKSGATIDAHGAVSYQRTTIGSATTRLGVNVRGREQTMISARFGGGRATGTFRDRFTSRKLNCSSDPLPFTAFLDGTTQAPVHDATSTTGRYTGTALDHVATGKQKPGKRQFSLDLFLPWGVVTQLKFQWTLVCGKQSVREASTFGFLPVSNGSFTKTGRGVDSLAGGVRGRWSYLLGGRFVRAAGASIKRPYSFTGHFSYKVDYLHGKQRLSSCRQAADLTGNGPRG